MGSQTLSAGAQFVKEASDDALARYGALLTRQQPELEKYDTLQADREQFLLEHLPVVRYLARRVHVRLPEHIDLEDLVSAGAVGLMDAYWKFDHKKNVQFRSYAQFRIRGAILDFLRSLDWSPRDLRRKGRAVESAILAVTKRVERAPAETEIAAEMGLNICEYQELLGELKGLEIGCLHLARSGNSVDDELVSVPNPAEESPLLRCMKGEASQRLADAISGLPEREKLVLNLYYYDEMTMKEISVVLGVVESRVSQIRTSAILHLRASLGERTKDKQPQETLAKRIAGRFAAA